MDSEKLRLLLRSNETGTLEFKQEWYKIDEADSPAPKRQKGELVKDVLSLANGNTVVAGEEAYLIIGASNRVNAEGTSELFDVAHADIDEHRILGIINAYCSPPLEEIHCETITLDGARVVVITIPRSPHLYETTKKLETPNRPYDKHTVFVRHGEDIDTASAKEREKISLLKQIAVSERRNAPPLPFGAVVGALAGGIIASSLTGEKIVANKGTWQISGLIGVGLGGFLGWLSGYIYTSYYEIRSKWLRIPPIGRVVSIGVALVVSTGGGLLLGYIKKELKRQAVKGVGAGKVIGTWVDSGLLDNSIKGNNQS